jgi:hypothetical protein
VNHSFLFKIYGQNKVEINFFKVAKKLKLSSQVFEIFSNFEETEKNPSVLFQRILKVNHSFKNLRAKQC